MYQIEKNIPLPGSSKYPLRDMGVGDSFLLVDALKKTEMAARNAIARFRMSHPDARFSVLRVPGENSKRVFRTV